MDGQLVIAVVFVAVAAGYVVRSMWRAVRGSPGGCASGCGKCASSEEPKSGRTPLPQV